MSIWDLYRKPVKYTGDKVPGLDAVYYTGNEGLQVPSTNSSEYASIMAFFYLSGLASYVYCTVTGRRAQRLYSTLTLCAVPAIWILHCKGDDVMVGAPYQLPLEYRLEYYPLTRRALERAIEDVSQGK
jgi:hypothetical protein